MCGIIGYVGRKPVVEVLLNGLQRLEYRGYDSAGMAAIDGGRLSWQAASMAGPAMEPSESPIRAGRLMAVPA